MVKKTHISLLFLGLFIVVSFLPKKLHAQDPEFSQFYANHLYLNPAFAGSHKCPRVNMVHRNQWPSLTGSFVTSSISYDQHINGLSGGLGFLVTTDNAANTLKSTRVAGMYAYQITVNRKFSVRLGAEAAFFQKSVDWNKLQFGDMIDPRRGFVYQTGDLPRGGNISGVDFSAGAMGFSELFYVGFAAHHLTQPNESLIVGESRLPMKITGHAGAVIPMAGGASKYTTNDVKLSPNILFRQQGAFTQLNMGLYVNKGSFSAGFWYRNRDAFIVLVGLQTEVLKIGYSYDTTISKLGASSGGAHEITLGLNFKCRERKRSFRTISCPSF